MDLKNSRCYNFSLPLASPLRPASLSNAIGSAMKRLGWQHRWPPTTGWRQSPWTLTQVGVHLPGRLHEVGGLIPGRQQGLPGLRNYPEIPAHLHHSLGHATHVAVPNGHMGHLGTPLTQNILNVTVELSSFGRPKKEKLEPHLHPLLNLVNRGVNQVNQQSIIANERPVTFASTQRTSTVGNGDTAGRRNGSSTASFLAITVGQQCCHGFSLHPDRRQAILPPIQVSVHIAFR
ncbi:hypothetical protein Taro_001846 [Colocasia esculenta]|uniref:Uncharacterized protein n=1 Tax=Colocasia esculenta TaxID=4460 RepID=A0A843THF4_COLES|nr:hypothetical protein [Colocasia esculenta]